MSVISDMTSEPAILKPPIRSITLKLGDGESRNRRETTALVAPAASPDYRGPSIESTFMPANIEKASNDASIERTLKDAFQDQQAHLRRVEDSVIRMQEDLQSFRSFMEESRETLRGIRDVQAQSEATLALQASKENETIDLLLRGVQDLSDQVSRLEEAPHRLLSDRLSTGLAIDHTGYLGRDRLPLQIVDSPTTNAAHTLTLATPASEPRGMRRASIERTRLSNDSHVTYHDRWCYSGPRTRPALADIYPQFGIKYHGWNVQESVSRLERHVNYKNKIGSTAALEYGFIVQVPDVTVMETSAKKRNHDETDHADGDSRPANEVPSKQAMGHSRIAKKPRGRTRRALSTDSDDPLTPNPAPSQSLMPRLASPILGSQGSLLQGRVVHTQDKASDAAEEDAHSEDYDLAQELNKHGKVARRRRVTWHSVPAHVKSSAKRPNRLAKRKSLASKE